jgi:tRNA-2-methylthio-N6-dimethylallyladenosine synthase
MQNNQNAIIDPPYEEPARQNYFIEKCRAIIEERCESLGVRPTACPRAFGCQMNARDTEKLAGILQAIGYRIVDDDEADLVIYDTCTVRENADERVFGRLGFLNNMKKHNPGKIIGVCGCMTQTPGMAERFRERLRFVDLVFGTYNVYKLAELLYRRLTGEEQVIEIWDKADFIVEDLPVKREYSYKSGVNIMYGCNNFCSYCIVPYVRGRERSRRPDEIVEEVKRLASDGVREIMLLGQNVNSYGKGLDTPCSFARLLHMVSEVDGIDRIRFMTSHPKDLSDELIDAMASIDKICRHLHLPLQSGSDRILKRMNRHYTKEVYLDLARRIRAAVPGISLTTDIIVGFPGETDEDFEHTMDVVGQVRFQSAFTFQYSPRTGTPAASFPDQVPHEDVQRRFDRLLRKVQEISTELTREGAGRVEPALVEAVSEKNPGCVTGRLGNNLMVHFPGDESMIGEIHDVMLTEARGFYYMGRLLK